ncbi:unnamed protein product [Symbiodinium natans]|uniref:Uncharacterized protein n=1 Tax=Symbiodinium natans TaxID=878477 RepID=A0A812KBQ2_9DINO|nr:unnamed protein product [Symbiodinium natans]
MSVRVWNVATYSTDLSFDAKRICFCATRLSSFSEGRVLWYAAPLAIATDNGKAGPAVEVGTPRCGTPRCGTPRCGALRRRLTGRPQLRTCPRLQPITTSWHRRALASWLVLQSTAAVGRPPGVMGGSRHVFRRLVPRA